MGLVRHWGSGAGALNWSLKRCRRDLRLWGWASGDTDRIVALLKNASFPPSSQSWCLRCPPGAAVCLPAAGSSSGLQGHGAADGSVVTCRHPQILQAWWENAVWLPWHCPETVTSLTLLIPTDSSASPSAHASGPGR